MNSSRIQVCAISRDLVQCGWHNEYGKKSREKNYVQLRFLVKTNEEQNDENLNK